MYYGLFGLVGLLFTLVSAVLWVWVFCGLLGWVLCLGLRGFVVQFIVKLALVAFGLVFGVVVFARGWVWFML